jgi:hypothetical protein
MSSFYQLLEKQVDATLIDVRDFAKYHRHVINEQKDSIAVVKIMKMNNERYEFFEKSYLLPNSKDGKISNKEACLLWMVYEDMREVLSYHDALLKGTVRGCDEKIAKFWIGEFERPVNELYDYGPNTISSAYGAIIEYHREWFVKEKYARIYSLVSEKEEDAFEKYVELARKSLLLIQGQEFPFDIMSIKEKVHVLTSVRN